jgi:hypothetical protein
MRRILNPLLLTLVGIALAGCASGGASSTDPDVSVRRADRNQLTEAELEQSGAQTLKQAIELLRPQWLQTRGPTNWGVAGQTGDQIVVYVENQRVGTIGELERIRVSETASVRFLSGIDATNRYGSGHTLGAIVIARRKG